EWALTIHGASDVSPEDAQRDARDRLQRVVAAGGPARTSGSGLEYYPLRRLPEELLEDVHAPDGALVAAITRNRYGSAVLNTDAARISASDLVEPCSRERVKHGGRMLWRRVAGRRREQPRHREQDPGASGPRSPGRRGEHQPRT